MTANSGRRSTSELSILQNMVWANALVAANNGSTSKLVFLFPQSSTGADSTMFHKILDHGRPAPALHSVSGGMGPALLAEKEFPGTLRWLLHPLWFVLGTAEFPFLRVIFQTMAVLQITCSEPLIRFNKGEVVRSNIPMLDQLQSLEACGSLDSLVAVILLAQEAFCLCSPKSHEEVFGFCKEAISEWKCISWMPGELKSALIQCILHKIRRCAPAPMDFGLADTESFQRSILGLETARNDFQIGGFAAALDNYKNSISHEEFRESMRFEISDVAKSTFCKRILPWLNAGAP